MLTGRQRPITKGRTKPHFRKQGLLILGALGRLTISVFIAKVGELSSLGVVLLSLLLGSLGASSRSGPIRSQIEGTKQGGFALLRLEPEAWR